jgi:hypothetical protein
LPRDANRPNSVYEKIKPGVALEIESPWAKNLEKENTTLTSVQKIRNSKEFKKTTTPDDIRFVTLEKEFVFLLLWVSFFLFCFEILFDEESFNMLGLSIKFVEEQTRKLGAHMLRPSGNSHPEKVFGVKQGVY